MNACNLPFPTSTSAPISTQAADAPPLPPERVLRAIGRDERGGAYGRFKSFRLESAYQPIYSLAHHRAVGFEALLRARDPEGAPVSPLTVFASTESEAEIVCLDRVCRALHTDNHRLLASDDTWLFLNTDPRVLVPGGHYGSFFRELLEHYGLPAHRVVVEILEGAIDDEGRLAEAVAYYRELGCLVAVDDFGAGHSNFDRIWRIAPDIVKLDRSVIAHSAESGRARRILANLTALIHEAGCLVLAEGIEREEEAMIALEAEVDMAQGYYFARPAPATPHDGAKHPLITALGERFRDHASTGEAHRQRLLAPYRDAFDQTAATLSGGAAFDLASLPLMAVPHVSRCYLLGGDGFQRAALSPRHERDDDPRYAPLASRDASSWFRRAYFRRAMARPGQQYTSPPYLSLTGVHMCVTLSMAIPVDGERVVLCCDLDWDALNG